jgi:LEA14-like dessication related protein
MALQKKILLQQQKKHWQENKNSPMKFLSLLTFCTFLLLCSCIQPKNLVYQDMEDVHVNLFQQPPVSLSLKLYNPNNRSVVLKRATANVFINNSPVGTIKLDTTYRIPALDTFLLPLSLYVDMQKALPAAVSLIFEPDINLKLDGSIKIGKRGFYKSFPIHYEGKQPIAPVRMELNDNKNKK